VRVGALCRHTRAQQAVVAALRARDGVAGVEASTVTATVLVLFDARTVTPDDLVRWVEAALDDLERAPAPPPDARDTWRAPRPRSIARPRQRRSVATTAVTDGAGAAAPAESRWHVESATTALAMCGADERIGLTDAAAQERLRIHGPNALSLRPPPSMWELVVGQVEGLPTMLLLASSALSIVTGGFADAVVILAVVGLNAGIGVVTERRAARVIRALTSTTPPSALVLRSGSVRTVPAADVVVGDILVLARGTYVAADARALEATDLTVDESALTGESLPAMKSTTAVARYDVPLGERKCLVYRGTLVTGGGGRAVVVAIGDATEAGRVQRLIQEAARPRTPLQDQLDQLGRQLVGIAGGVAVATLVAGIARGQPLLAIVRATIALAVAAVPEGLPTVSTTTLAAGLRALGRRGLLFRRLEAVEAMGAVQVVCLDKTGTITTNRMRVVEVMTGSGRVRADDPRDPADAHRVADLRAQLETAVLCSEATVTEHDGQVRIDGSATESAIIAFALEQGVDVNLLRAACPLLRLDHRADTRMFMATRHACDDGSHLVAVKGRPDEVLARCRWWMVEGEQRPLSPDDRSAIESSNEQMAGLAYRVLGVARRTLRNDDLDGEAELIWQGLLALEDPVRPGVKELIKTLRRAGIRTIMITGDQSTTALAVARAVGLAEDGQIEILDSTRIDALDPEVLRGLVQRVQVFSRVSPTHKLQIVRALQSSGQVVAMTGDGINDGPALRGADVGIAIGREGTEVAREVADVVLQSDDLPVVLQAIARGRTLRVDLRKAVHFVTATNLSELAFMFTAVAGGFGLPLNPKQLLWINLVTDVFPELALAVEPPEGDVLDRPPDDPRRALVGPDDYRRIAIDAGVMTAATLGSFLYAVRRYGIGPQASTLAFNTLLAAQLLHSISARSESHSIFDAGWLAPNRYVTYAVGGGLSLQLLAEFGGSLRRALGTQRLPLRDILVGMSLAGGSFVAIELIKQTRIAATVKDRNTP